MVNSENKNQKTIIALIIVSILVVFVGVSYAFITFVINGQKQVIINAGVLDLYLDEKNGITISNALPMYDEVGMIQDDVFEFSLVNKTSNATNYILKLVKIGATNELSEYDVKYGLIKEGNANINYLAHLNDGVIDSGTIAGNDKLDYELRLWITSEVTSNEAISGKSLSYRLEVTAVQLGIEQTENCFNYTVNDYVVKDYNACAELLIDRSVETEYDRAILECEYITEEETYFIETYPAVWEEMLNSGIVSKEYGATITGYTCSDQFVRIPDTVTATVDENGVIQMANTEIKVPVVAIGSAAFQRGASPKSSKNERYSVQPLASTSVSTISKVTLPDTVLHIQENAFGSLRLNEVELSSNIQVIGYRSFSGNLLSNIDLPNSLVFIGSSAFSDNNLVNITIPNKILYIGGGALSTNNNLTKIINKTGKAFNWQYICFEGGYSGSPEFITGTASEGIQTVIITSE